MNILLKHKYFRRECFVHTWTLSCLAYHIPDKLWYLNYVENNVEDKLGTLIENFDTICKLCENGKLRILKKVEKYVYDRYKHIRLDIINDRIVYKYSLWKYKTIDIMLIVSSFSGHLPVVQYLVEQGADIHTDNDKALRWSAEKGHIAVFQYLADQGGDIHALKKEVFRKSAENGHLPIVQYLVEHGGESIRSYGNIALLLAIRNDHLHVIEYLLKQGCMFVATDVDIIYNSDIAKMFNMLMKKVFVNQ